MSEDKYPAPSFREISLVGLCSDYARVYKVDVPELRLIAKKLGISIFKRSPQPFLVSEYVDADDAERLAIAIQNRCELIIKPLVSNETITGIGERVVEVYPH